MANKKRAFAHDTGLEIGRSGVWDRREFVKGVTDWRFLNELKRELKA